jgi:stalled ribosome alternative rescue factor ArfA
MERKGQERKRKKRGMQFIPYDYEAAYNKSIEFMHEWILENMFSHGKKMVYALKEITAGEQFEIEIYPQFRKMDDVPKEGQRIVKDNSKAQKNLNDKNARKYVERKINQNFGDRDIWLTLTYDDEHLPPDGDIDAAIKNMQRFIRRVNYQRKKRGLPKAKYVYVTEYNEAAEIRWHHHLVMDGALDMDTVEKCWGQSSRNEVRRLQKDENGLSGMANYIVKEKKRIRSEKRWNSSQGLIDPDIRVVHSKQPEKGKGSYKRIGKYVDEMVKNQNVIEGQMKKWYPDFDFKDAAVYYNDFNGMFYIHARMRKRRSQTNDERAEEKT